MQVQHQTFKTNGAFFIESDIKRIAEITYLKYGYDKIIIDSSFTNEENNSKTILIEIAKTLTLFAKKNKLQIISVCPDITQIMQETIFL